MRREAGPGEVPERTDVVVLACASSDVPRLFLDDILTCCSVCGLAIYHRPGALAELGPGARAACLPCAARYAQQHTEPGEPVTFGITARTLDEVAAHLGERKR